MAGRDLIQRQIETERHGLGFVLRLLDDGKRRTLENFRLPLIQTHVSNQRYGRGVGMLVGLEEHIEVAALAEDPRNAWDELLAVQDGGIDVCEVDFLL